jgi:hypothetical protein
MDMQAEADQHNQHSTLAISTPSAVREANLQLQGADDLGSVQCSLLASRRLVGKSRNYSDIFW